jgi:hypothetical protein
MEEKFKNADSTFLCKVLIFYDEYGYIKQANKLNGLSPRANYTERRL